MLNWTVFLVALSLLTIPPIDVHADSACPGRFNPQTEKANLNSIQARLAPKNSTQPSLLEIPDLVIATANVENFYIPGLAPPSGVNQVPTPKPEEAAVRVASRILNSDPDIIAFQEIMGEATAVYWGRNYLADSYQWISTRGNDARGIQVMIAVKKNLPFSYRIESHADTRWNDPLRPEEGPVRLHSRDIIVVYLTPLDAPPDSPPYAAIIAGHMKAQINRCDDRDPDSALLARAQYDDLAKILKNIRSRFGSDFPYILAMDANRDLHIDPIPERLFTDDLVQDSLIITGQPRQNRLTHYYFPRFGDGPAQFRQLDLLGVAPSIQNAVISASVTPAYDLRGQRLPLPMESPDLELRGSDHDPIVMHVRNQGRASLMSNYSRRVRNWAATRGLRNFPTPTGRPLSKR